jgi:hypothetical protein
MDTQNANADTSALQNFQEHAASLAGGSDINDSLKRPHEDPSVTIAATTCSTATSTSTAATTTTNNNNGVTPDEQGAMKRVKLEGGGADEFDEEGLIGSDGMDIPMTPKARAIRLEQNRKAARESRRRKKMMIEGTVCC